MRTPFSVRSCVAVLALFSSANLACADTELRWKFQAGQEMHFVSEQKSDMTMAGGPTAFSMSHGMTLNIMTKVAKVNEDGTVDLSTRVQRTRAAIEGGPFGKAEIDSDDDTAAPDNPALAPLAGIMKAMVGPEFKIRTNARGETLKIELPGEVKDILKGAGAGGLGGSMFSEETLGDMMLLVVPFPEGKVSKDQSWSDHKKIEMPGMGAMHQDMKFTYAGVEEKGDRKLEKIGLMVTMSIQAGEGPMQVSIKDQKSSGYLLFDNEAGRPVESVVNQEFTMVIDVGSQQMEYKTKTTGTTKVVPAEKAKSKAGS